MNRDPIPRLCLFGLPRLEIGDVCLDRFETRRSAFILARLAIAHQKRMTRAQLAEVLWPEDDFEGSRQRLRQELTRLRHTLGEYEFVLETTIETLQLDLAHLDIDIDRFERLARIARQTESPAERKQILEQAVAIAVSPFMAGATEDWIQVERARLNVGRYNALVELGGLRLADADATDALVLARDAIEIAPVKEAGHLLAIEALRELGHLEEARRQFQTLRRIVTAEHGGRLSANAEQVAATLQSSPRSEVSGGLQFLSPAPTEPIFGRDEQVAWIVGRLDPAVTATRLVTVCGIGGIGKTHLLRYACRALSHPYAERVGFIDLSNLADAAMIAPHILRSLGLGSIPTDDPVGQIARVFAEGPALLALDNMEQFGAAAAPIVRRLLDEAPVLRLLVGSRIPLNLAGEQRLNLSPLSLPRESEGEQDARNSPALQLFMGVLEADGVSGTIRDEDWPVVSNIVRRLDGIPLGLQLVAPRLRTMEPRVVLREIEEGYAPVNRREDAPERHRTMHNAVKGSFDQLTPQLRQAVVALSIFRGGWTLESAERVCEIADPSATMEALIDASLVSYSSEKGRIRFRMLETIREYGREILPPQREADLQDRLVAWMVERSRTVAQDLVDLATKAEIDRLDPERDNLGEALRIALDRFPDRAFELGANLASFWLYRTIGYEANEFYRELFRRHAAYPETPTVLRASYGNSLIAHFIWATDRTEVFDRTIAMGRRMGDRSRECRVQVFKVYLAQNAQQYDECRRLLEEIESSAEVNGFAESEGFVMRAKGMFVQYQGQTEEAVSLLRNAVAWFCERNELFFQIRGRLDLAVAAVDVGDADLGLAALDGLLEMQREHAMVSMVPQTNCHLGHVALAQGRYEDALRFMRAAQVGWQSFGQPFRTADQWNSLGRTFLEMGRTEEAKDAFVRAATIWNREFPVATAVAVFGMSAAQLRQGEARRASRLFAVARREYEESGAKLNPFHLRFFDRLEAELREVCGDGPWDDGSLTLEEAVRLGALSRS